MENTIETDFTGGDYSFSTDSASIIIKSSRQEETTLDTTTLFETTASISSDKNSIEQLQSQILIIFIIVQVSLKHQTLRALEWKFLRHLQ